MLKYLLPIGIALIALGFAFVLISSIFAAERTESKVAVGGMIGFIPFGFATDKKMLWFVFVLMGIFFIFFMLTRFLLR